MYLVHWPGTNEAVMVDTWKGMEDLYKNNKVKYIGVSNFEPEHLEALLAQVSIKPVINQVEYHPYLTQHKLKLYLAKTTYRDGILVTIDECTNFK